jgi:hypothetical protein
VLRAPRCMTLCVCAFSYASESILNAYYTVCASALGSTTLVFVQYLTINAAPDSIWSRWTTTLQALVTTQLHVITLYGYSPDEAGMRAYFEVSEDPRWKILACLSAALCSLYWLIASCIAASTRVHRLGSTVDCTILNSTMSELAGTLAKVSCKY